MIVRQFFGKKSQLTLFAIIGIVLVISAALVFYMKSIKTSPLQELPDTEMDELSSFVTECLRDRTLEAVGYVGLGGGYVDSTPNDVLIAQLDPLNSEFFSMFDGNLIMPYWYYQNSVGVDQSGMPALTKRYDYDGSIQDQIENYVEDNLDSCLGEFRSFKNMNVDVNVNDDPIVSVSFTDSKVLSRMNMPLEIVDNGTRTKYSNFEVEIPIRLKRVYQLASEITEFEAESAFLERKTIELVNTYSTIDSDMLPPMFGGMEMKDCSDFEYWVVTDVKKNIKEMLTSNLPYVGIYNSDFTRMVPDESLFADEEEFEIAQGVYDRLNVKVSDNDYPFIRADISFMQDFPMELDFGGAGLLMPRTQEVDIIFAQYCFFEYRFYYDLKFPVLVTLYDSKSYAEGNEGYVFQFPLMVVIKDNFPRVSVTDLKVPPSTYDERTYQCEFNQRISGNVNIEVVDDRRMPVKDALVTFKCGPDYIYEYYDNGSMKNMTPFAEKCFIGKTDAEGKLVTKLPPCVGGGIIGVKHPEHLEIVRLTGDVLEGENYNYTFLLNRIVDVEVVVDKFFVTPPIPETVQLSDYTPDISEIDGEVVKCSPDPESMPLDPNENVMIRLTKIDEENGILANKPFAYYNSQKTTSIKLAPGIYEADLMLIRNERYPGEMTIRRNSQSKTVPSTMFQKGETIYYPDEDIVLPTLISGGSSFVFQVLPEKLYASSKVRFHVIDEGEPKYIESIGRAIKDREICSTLNPDMIEPEFSR